MPRNSLERESVRTGAQIEEEIRDKMRGEIFFKEQPERKNVPIKYEKL